MRLGRRSTVLATAAVLCALSVSASAAEAVTVGEPVETPLLLPDGTYTEAPPDVLPGRTGLSLVLTAEASARCDLPLGSTLIGPTPPDCRAAGRTVPQIGADYRGRTPETMPDGREHRRNYYGVYSEDRVRLPGGQTVVIGAAHGENKNLSSGGLLFQNTVYTGSDALVPPAGSCLSGPDPATGIYADCYAAYSGFVGLTWSPDAPDGSPSHGAPIDFGPVIWPAAGYASADGLTRLGHGVRHPDVLDGGDGFVYLYYHDDGFLPDYAQAGFRVARAPVTDLRHGWQTWVEADGRWVDSLPPDAAIGPESSRDGFPDRSPSAASTPLFPSDSSTFAVARIAGGRGFVGVDFGRDYTRPCTTADGRADWRSAMRLRVSTDHVHWSAPVALTGPDFDGCDFYANSRFSYPRFLDASGTSTKEVDLADFFLVGTQYGGKVWRVPVQAPDLAPPR